MHKFVPLLITLAVAVSLANAELQLVAPDNGYSLLSSGKLTQTLHAAVPVPVPAGSSSKKVAATLLAQVPSSASATAQLANEISSGENSSELNEADDESTPVAVTRSNSATGSSVPSSHSAAALRASLVLAAAGRTAVPAIHHTILPAEEIPLPITISTRPGLRTVIAPETITIQEPTIARIGQVVQQIPTAVSHQSQTVVHKHARVVTPIVAPAVRTTTSQVLRAYHTPIVYTPQAAVLRVLQN